MKHILILEDNKNFLDSLRKAVEGIDEKLRVFAATSVEEAFRILYDYRMDLFVLDIILTTKVPGDASGIRFAEKLRQIQNYKFTPMIFMTELADPKLYTYRYLHGFAFLEKPFPMEEAVEVITSALEFPTPDEKKKIVFFRKDGILLAVDLKKVVYAKVGQRKMNLHLTDESLDIPYLTVSQFLKQSQLPELVQCSRFTVANMLYVKSIDEARRFLQMRDNSRLEIGGAYLKSLKQQICIFHSSEMTRRRPLHGGVKRDGRVYRKTSAKNDVI